MLGETVLQLVVAENPSASEGFLEYYATEASGFIICVCMMYSFHIIEPHHAEGHVLRRSATASICYQVLFTIKALAVLQVWTLLSVPSV